MVRADGKIDPNGRTHRKINEKLIAVVISNNFKLPVASTDVKKLSELDYQDIAKELGCKVAAIKAVADVESSGDVFFSNGKPKILYEAHIFLAIQITYMIRAIHLYLADTGIAVYT